MAKEPNKLKKSDNLSNKLEGLSFVIGGNFDEKVFQAGLSELIECLGGQVKGDVTADTTHVVSNNSQSRHVKEANKLNRNGSAIQILDYAEAASMVMLTKDELVRAITDLPGRFLTDYLKFHKTDVSGSNLKCITLDGIKFHDSIVIDGADFSNSMLNNVEFQYKYGSVKDIKFDRSDIAACLAGRMKGCSFQDSRIKRLSLLNGAKLEDCNFESVGFQSLTSTNTSFKNCDFRDSRFEHSCSFLMTDFTNCQIRNVTMSGIQFQSCSFINCNLENSDFVHASLSDVTFAGSDLSNANLSGAILIETDFSRAIIDGAIFSDATVINAKFDPIQISKCMGLKESLEKGWNPRGPHLRAWENALETQGSLDSPWNITLGLVNAWRIFERFTITPSSVGADCQISIGGSRRAVHLSIAVNKKPTGIQYYGLSLLSVLAQLVARCGWMYVFEGAEIDFNSIKCNLSDSSLSTKDATKLALAACCEVFGIVVPDKKTLKESKSRQRKTRLKHLDILLTELRGGTSGVERWNSRSHADRLKAGNFKEVVLANLHLCDVQLNSLDFESANFEGTNLSRANLANCNLIRTNFKHANLEMARLQEAKACNADFSGALMKAANLDSCDLSKAIFYQTDLSGAKLNNARLTGADLSTAILRDAEFNDAEIDEHTKLPPNLNPVELKWCGTGPNPHAFKQVLAETPQAPLSFDEFLRRLEDSVDPERLEKSLVMLRSESFQLFADVTADALVGVVKSQTNAARVYSVRLTSYGVYSCCTQNLRPCGGLRGAMCKHLLVLIIGLTKAGQLDPTKADLWARASRIQFPTLDKNIMSETFLRYKATESGDLDWRPTVTIPEDFYSF